VQIYLEAHGADCVGDKDEAVVVGLVGHPQGGGVGVDPVSNNSIPNLDILCPLATIPYKPPENQPCLSATIPFEPKPSSLITDNSKTH
jgi:hypothetical protein